MKKLGLSGLMRKLRSLHGDFEYMETTDELEREDREEIDRSFQRVLAAISTAIENQKREYRLSD